MQAAVVWELSTGQSYDGALLTFVLVIYLSYCLCQYLSALTVKTILANETLLSARIFQNKCQKLFSKCFCFPRCTKNVQTVRLRNIPNSVYRYSLVCSHLC